MSSTTQPTDFEDLYTDVIHRVRANAVQNTTLDITKRLVNQALQDLHVDFNWPWAEREAYLTTHAPYREGSVSIDVSTSRTAVAGTDTDWATDSGYGVDNVRAGGKIVLANELDPHRVSAVTDDTNLTLEDMYIGADDLTDASYTYYEDEYDLADDFIRLVDIRRFGTAMALPVMGRREFYRAYPRNTRLSRPLTCTIIDAGLGVGGDNARRLILNPAPDRVYTIPYRYITKNLAVDSTGDPQEDLSADTDEPIVPRRYRHALVFYAVREWYRDQKDDTRFQAADKEYVDLVGRMATDFGADREKMVFVARRRRPGSGFRGRRYGNSSWIDQALDLREGL